MHPHLQTYIHTLATQVSFAKMAQSLDNTSSEALNTLVQSLAAKVDAALAPLTRLKWGEMEEVGDQSTYVNAVQAALGDTVAPLRARLAKGYFASLLDKTASLLMTRFGAHLLRIRRVSDAGVQQLLLDLTALKTIALGLPSCVGGGAGAGGGAGGGGGGGGGTCKSGSSSYVRLVNLESGKVESVLKVLLSPAAQLPANYQAMIRDGDEGQLQRLLEMKGLKAQSNQVFDVAEEAREGARALGEMARASVEQSSLRANFDSMAGLASSTLAKTFT